MKILIHGYSYDEESLYNTIEFIQGLSDWNTIKTIKEKVDVLNMIYSNTSI